MTTINFIKNISKGCDLVEVNNEQKILKHSQYIDPTEIPYAANELICYNLLQLLKSKNLNIIVPKVEPYIPGRVIHFSNIRYTFPCVLIDHIGDHSRIDTKKIINNANVPDWIYYFDKWIGKIDGSSNLLHHKKSNNIIPIDNEFCFTWTMSRPPHCHLPSNMNIATYNPMVINAKSERSKRKIKSLTDQEIWNAVTNISKDFCPSPTLVGIYSGLCYRRDLL